MFTRWRRLSTLPKSNSNSRSHLTSTVLGGPTLTRVNYAQNECSTWLHIKRNNILTTQRMKVFLKFFYKEKQHIHTYTNGFFKTWWVLIKNIYIYIYTVGHFNLPTWISRNLSQIEKNGPDKSRRGQRGSSNGTKDLDLELDFQGYFKVSDFLKWEYLFLTPDLKRAGNFTFKMICLSRSWQGRMKVKFANFDFPIEYTGT